MLSRNMMKCNKVTRNFGFSLGSTLFNFPNTNDSHYGVSNASPLSNIDGHSTQTAVIGNSEINITELSNGITVVTQSPDVAGTVGLQVLLNVGTRDETSTTSGSLLSIQNSYYKTVLNTNETVNYGMVQQSGGSFTMDYDQENAIFKASCLGHDVVDIFNMVSDCAIEPRSVVAANVAIGKGKNTHALAAQTGADFNDTLFRTAYGLRGLGNPILGLASNIEYLNASTLQQFQIQNITPNRITIGASNVDNHAEFVDLVESESAFANIPGQEEVNHNFREAAGYQGGEVKTDSTGNRIDIAIAFETQGWTGTNALALQLASTIIGSHSSSTIDQPIQAPSNRSFNQLVSQLSFFDDVEALNFNFSDSGLWGIRVGGPGSNAQDLFGNAVGQLQGLASNVTEAELQAAKNTLKVQILRGLERPEDRLHETLRNINTYGRPVHGEYVSWINNVSVEDVQSAVSSIIGGNPTILAHGAQASTLNTSF